MLNELNYENYFAKFNKYPKTKYTVFVNNGVHYEFVTTSKPEDECINILKEITDSLMYTNKVNYIVYAKTNGEKRILYKGRTKCYDGL